MEKKDFRIGNICNIQVFGIGDEPVAGIENAILVAEDFVKYKAFEGIPITEARLLKLGFEKTVSELYDEDGRPTGEFETHEGHFHHKKLEFMMDYYLPYNCFNQCPCFSFTENKQKYCHYVTVEYVHQLQNLYFALTGEELNVK